MRPPPGLQNGWGPGTRGMTDADALEGDSDRVACAEHRVMLQCGVTETSGSQGGASNYEG